MNLYIHNENLQNFVVLYTHTSKTVVGGPDNFRTTENEGYTEGVILETLARHHRNERG